MEIFWDVASKCASLAGIISFIISILTWNNTRSIRSSMLAYVETSEYKKAIDEQINGLAACKSLLTNKETQGIDANFFLNLMVQLRDISIAYETILPKKLIKKINALHTHIKNNLYGTNPPYGKQNLAECISLLVYIIAELRKEKNLNGGTYTKSRNA